MDGGVAVFVPRACHLPPVRGPTSSRVDPEDRPVPWRCALRITLLVAVTVIVYVFGATEIPSLRSFVLDYSLLNIYSPHQPDVRPPLQSWTLSTELTFYVPVPLWLVPAARPRRRPSRIRSSVGVVALVAASALWKGCAQRRLRRR